MKIDDIHNIRRFTVCHKESMGITVSEKGTVDH